MPDHIQLRSRAIKSALTWLEANMAHWRDSLEGVKTYAETLSPPYKKHSIVTILDRLTGTRPFDLIMLDTTATRHLFEALSNKESFVKLMANTARQTKESLDTEELLAEELFDLVWGLALAYAARDDLVTTVLIFKTMVGVDIRHDLARETEMYILSQQHFTGYFGKFNVEFFPSQPGDVQLAVKSELTLMVLKALIEAHGPSIY
jgi:hypothetical protein